MAFNFPNFLTPVTIQMNNGGLISIYYIKTFHLLGFLQSLHLYCVAPSRVIFDRIVFILAKSMKRDLLKTIKCFVLYLVLNS